VRNQELRAIYLEPRQPFGSRGGYACEHRPVPAAKQVYPKLLSRGDRTRMHDYDARVGDLPAFTRDLRA